MSQSSVFHKPKYMLSESCPRNWFSEGFAKTLNEGYSLSIVIVGKRTGIGKTYFTLGLAEMFDPAGFGPKEVDEGHYCFYARDYIRAIKNTQPFSWYIFDEPGRKGSGGAKQEWQTETNKALASTAQISRFMLPISAFIVPHRGFIASSLLGLAQLLLVLDNRGSAKVYHIEVSEFDGNIYTPYLGHITFSHMPSHELIVAAEKKKAEMWSVDTSKWIHDIEKMEVTQKSAYDIAQEIIAKGHRESLTVNTDKGQTLSTAKIAQYAKCSRTKSFEIRQFLQIDNGS